MLPQPPAASGNDDFLHAVISIVKAEPVILSDRLCENSFGALRRSSGRTVKYWILLSPQPVRAEATRSMDRVFTRSAECEGSKPVPSVVEGFFGCASE